MVSNQSGKRKSLTIEFNSKRLSIKGDDISDAMVGSKIVAKEGKLRLDLDYLGWQMVWLK